ncbi:FG-GAP-like repeat-containing protein [bacterium]|nr:FG-GAP-like repeat-containing protein [bacterium]
MTQHRERTPSLTRAARLMAALAVAAALHAAPAGAGNPNWPNGPGDDPRDALPDDPLYAAQWSHWSYIPESAMNTIRPAEIALGSGIHVDRAWQVTVGQPSVVIAACDTGVHWDDLDLVEKIPLNTGELPLPEGASVHDANGDDRVNVRDYDMDSRVFDANGNGVIDANDLTRIFEDGIDGDDNGYIDDIAGWDFLWDDNNPFDDTDAKHGTGVAARTAGRTNDGYGYAGTCPECMLMPLRVSDGFVGYVNHFNEAAFYAVDNGARVILHANSTINFTPATRQAIDYAWDHDILYVTILGDAASFHHVYPGALPRAFTVQSFVHDTRNFENAASYLRLSNCSGFGPRALVGASYDCASVPTGIVAGVAGLVYSRGIEVALDPPLSAGEVWQLLIGTVDDVDIPDSWGDPEQFESRPGWDHHFGYGRINARRAIDRIAPGTIPPVAEIVSPDWFAFIDPARVDEIAVTFTAAARRAPSFAYTLEAAPGVEPWEHEFIELCANDGVTTDAEVTCPLDPSALSNRADDPVESPFQYNATLRLTVTDSLGNRAVDRRTFYIRRDAALMPTSPLLLESSLEGSPQPVDMDGDGVPELVIAQMNGRVDVIDATGASEPGWPVFVDAYPAFDGASPANHLAARAYSDGLIEPFRQGIWGTPAVGDLDGDGGRDVVVTTMEGFVYAWDADGNLRFGFPVAVDPANAHAADAASRVEIGIYAAPVIADLTGDGRLEIVAAAMDGFVYAWDAGGEILAGFPVACWDPEGLALPARFIASPAVGDLNGDGILDIVAGTTQIDERNGLAYAIHGDGALHDGGPFLPGWPVRIAGVTQEILPFLGYGIAASPSLADFDGDGRVEAAFLAGISMPVGIDGDGSPTWSGLVALFGKQSAATQFAGLSGMSFLTWADVNADNVPDLLSAGLSVNYMKLLSDYGHRILWESYLYGLDGRTGRQLPYFPLLAEDLMVANGPTVAHLDADVSPEILIGTGGYILHAYNQFGEEAEGFPKFTGQWVSTTPIVADLTGNGYYEVVAGSRDGSIFIWRTCSPAGRTLETRGFHHDERNTGNYTSSILETYAPVDPYDPFCGDPPPNDDDDDDATGDDDASGNDDADVADAGDDDDDEGCCGC